MVSILFPPLRISPLRCEAKIDMATSKAKGKAIMTSSVDHTVSFRDVVQGPNLTKLKFRLVHFWEAKNLQNKGSLIGIELLLIDEEIFTKNKALVLPTDRFHICTSNYSFWCIIDRLASCIRFHKTKWKYRIYDRCSSIWSNYWRTVWSLAHATRLGKAMAGMTNLCVLWSYRRLYCWTDSLLGYDVFS